MSGNGKQAGAAGMASTLRPKARRFTPCLVSVCLPIWIAAALAQASAAPPPGPAAVRVFHPEGPALAYDVATIKPADPNQPYAGTTLRRYIANAYGVPIPWGVPGVEFPGAQVLGGPAWIDSDKYEIKGVAPDELRTAMEKMPGEERSAKVRTMQQALLADRFHLKVHFETREMAIFEMVPARGGLKIKPLEPAPAGDAAKPPKPGEMSPGSMGMSVRLNGATMLNSRATNMGLFLNALRGQSPEVAGRPIVDKTGFAGTFDLTDFRFQGLVPPQHDPGVTVSDPDTPSLSQSLEQSLGLKLVAAKGQVEIVVIDSIDRPTEN
jgi:uncharacterized protein (TIGR03435 family)